MVHPELFSSLAQLSNHWNKIEKRLKSAEQVLGDVVTPSINELRYAGRQVVDAWKIYEAHNNGEGVDEKQFSHHVSVAKQYLINADHDIVDAVGLWISIRLNDIISQYGYGFLKENISDFDEKDELLKQLQIIIACSREQRRDRISEYDHASEKLIPTLLDTIEKINMVEAFGIRKRKKDRYIVSLATAISIISSIITIFSVAISWDQYLLFFRRMIF